jgi:hypothetical protein
MRAVRGRGFALALVLLGAALAAAGCHGGATTGLRVTATWDGLTVDQLEFSVLAAGGPDAGAAILPATPRPAHAGAALTSGQDVIVLLSDDLDGASVACHVNALHALELQQIGQSPAVTVHRGQTVPCAVSLGATPLPLGQAQGAACADGRQCTTGHCADGVCCDTACDGVCLTCNPPSSPGTCSPIAAGARPRLASDCPADDAATCAGNGMCDGHGACGKYPDGTPCGDGTCNAGSIVGGKVCDGNGRCLPGPVVTCAPFLCDASTSPPRCLQSCTTSAQCVAGRPCEDGSCGKKADGAACTSDEQCQNAHCVDGTCCATACAGACTSCNQVGHEGTCRPVAAGGADPHGLCTDSRTADPASCGSSGVCDGQGGCLKYAADTVCHPASCTAAVLTRTSTCDGQGTCQGGVVQSCNPFGCRNGQCNGACTGDADCAAGNTCNATTMSCGLKGIGQACGGNAECASTICADGVCCNDTCDGPCQSCALPSSPGVCKNVAPGAADPHRQCIVTAASTCGTDGMCDGNGACRLYPAATLCAPASCAGSTRTLMSICDGSGTCVAGQVAACAPYRCNGASCFVSCGSDAECLAPYVCLGGACGLKPSGASCLLSNECQSGACTDSVCCESSSCGSCKACNVAGNPGHCTPVPPMATDPRGVCVDMGASSCGTDGKCDGNGGCHRYGAGTTCGAAGCSGMTMVQSSACDGNGTCVGGTRFPCAPFVCDPSGVCKSTCVTSADCVAPNQCVGGSCGLKPLGAMCAASSECASTHCTDGACCDQSACSSCQACNVSGRAGTCNNVPVGVPDPRAVCRIDAPTSCGQNGKCDGNGGCQLQLPGTTCGPATCTGSILTPMPACDGAGNCRPSMTSDCSPYACTGGACAAGCAQPSDCAPPYTCLGAVCKKRVLGTGCTADAQCDTGHCVDGACCQAAACELCQSCNVAGSAGSCAYLPAGTPDPQGGCATTDPSTCGLDGTCDGAGACRDYPAGTVCAAATCSGKKSNNPQTCNGKGRCVTRGTVNCSPNSCDDTTGLCP